MNRHLVALLTAFVLGACTNEKIQYITRPPFNPGPDSTQGFLGYFTAGEKQTNCGNCHSGFQAEWKGTKHASAWADLHLAVANPPAYCSNCHTTNQYGNAVDDATNAGYLKVADSAYYDVQCESCHGPGFTHAQAPSISNTPLARIGIPTDTIVAATSPTCGACHHGAHDPFMEEWSRSPHSGNVGEVIESYVTNPTGEAACMACHEGRKTLEAWGVKTNYVEKNDPINPATAMPVTCAVCHDPHDKTHEAQLRWAIDDPDPTQNLCMKCHLRRVEPPATSPRGPHAPQGGVLLGYAGWWPNVRDTITATHGNVAANRRLCAGCHVNRVTVTDPATGSFVFQSVGHLFSPDPCLDAQGRPASWGCLRPGDSDSGGYRPGERAFTGCQAAGCHNSAAQAEQAFAANRATIQALANQLWDDNDGDKVLYDTLPGGAFQAFDPGDTGLLTQLADTDAAKAFNYKDRVVSTPEGVFFNVRLVGEERYDNGDKSHGAHNPLLAQTLLTESINALEARYPYLPAPPPRVQQLMAAVEHKVQAYRAAKAGVRQTSSGR